MLTVTNGNEAVMRWISNLLRFGAGQARQSVHQTQRRARPLLGLAILGAMAMTLAGADVRAETQPACGPRHDVLAVLADRFKEVPVGIGLAEGGNLIELLTSTAGSTWTLIITTPKGATCILAAGEDWQTDRTTALNGQGI